MKNKIRNVLTIAAIGATLGMFVACSANPYAPPNKTVLKDMSAEGYEIGMFQRVSGTEHNRAIQLFVDSLGSFPDPSFNILEGSYYNTGTEAPEHLRDPFGRMIFTQTEMRRYFDFWDNAREDATNIMLFDPGNGNLYTAAMARFKTEWWGDSDVRAISVNNGPIQFRLSGITDHLGIETQQVFAVVTPEQSQDYSWMFNQDNAGKVKDYFTGLAQRLENTGFNPSGEHVLISTRDSDNGLDWLGLETIPAQGELYDGTVQYVIAPSYAVPPNWHNQPFAGRGLLDKKLFGHQGAPDRSNKLGSSLDTLFLAMGTIDNPTAWIPRAKLIVNHPLWSNQTEYEFYRIGEDGSEDLMGVLQRTYNDKTQIATTSEGETIITDLAGTNNYLAKGDLEFIENFLVLLGGQQKPLGIDYKTSYMDYGLDLIRIGQGMVSEEGMEPEMVASLNVDADATINNVVRAAEDVLGVQPTQYFSELMERQNQSNAAFQESIANSEVLMQLYGITGQH